MLIIKGSFLFIALMWDAKEDERRWFCMFELFHNQGSDWVLFSAVNSEVGQVDQFWASVSSILNRDQIELYKLILWLSVWWILVLGLKKCAL